jgi:hypothetical protein
MSGIVTGRVFWTEMKDLSYSNTKGEQVNIKETSANDFGDNSWQSFETIAQKASIERRSVIRVVRALLANNYLKIDSLTKYGTHNFSVVLDSLGEPPKKYAKVGRPKTSDLDANIGDPEAKTSDPEAEIGDPEAEIGDPPSPKPLSNPPRSSNKPKRKKKDATPQPPEIILFKEIVKHYPKQMQRETVIEALQSIKVRLGRDVTADDLQPFYTAWGKVSGNEWSLVWLTDWAVPGFVPNGKGKQTTPGPQPKQDDPDVIEKLRRKAQEMFFPAQQETA